MRVPRRLKRRGSMAAPTCNRRSRESAPFPFGQPPRISGTQARWLRMGRHRGPRGRQGPARSLSWFAVVQLVFCDG